MKLDLEQVAERVKAQHELNIDHKINLTFATPVVKEDSVALNFDGVDHTFTEQGLSSFLSRVKIPTGFFKRSSRELQADILAEHFPKQNKQDALVRLSSNRVRYVGSDKYSRFDDIHVVEALQKVADFNQYHVREFYQTTDNMIMRVTTKDPIQRPGLRPFYPGVQITNSEVGKASVRIAFMLWEEVCTNGMTVARDEFASFERRHIGKRNLDSLAAKASEFLGRMDLYKEQMEVNLMKALETPAEVVIERIADSKQIPAAIKEIYPNFLPQYVPAGNSPSGLDILSAYTEAIQQYNWDSRLQQEEIAGSILLDC